MYIRKCGYYRVQNMSVTSQEKSLQRNQLPDGTIGNLVIINTVHYVLYIH